MMPRMPRALICRTPFALRRSKERVSSSRATLARPLRFLQKGTPAAFRESPRDIPAGFVRVAARQTRVVQQFALGKTRIRRRRCGFEVLTRGRRGTSPATFRPWDRPQARRASRFDLRTVTSTRVVPWRARGLRAGRRLLSCPHHCNLLRGYRRRSWHANKLPLETRSDHEPFVRNAIGFAIAAEVDASFPAEFAVAF